MYIYGLCAGDVPTNPFVFVSLFLKFAANLSFFFISSKKIATFFVENAFFLCFLSLFYYLCVRK